MEKILQIIQSANWEFEIPETITQIGATALQYGKFLGLLILGVLLLSSLTRLLFGKENQINLAITAAMEILCLYVINIVICALGLDYKLFLSPLPFVGMSEDYLYLFPLLSAGAVLLRQSEGANFDLMAAISRYASAVLLVLLLFPAVIALYRCGRRARA